MVFRLRIYPSPWCFFFIFFSGELDPRPRLCCLFYLLENIGLFSRMLVSSFWYGYFLRFNVVSAVLMVGIVVWLVSYASSELVDSSVPRRGLFLYAFYDGGTGAIAVYSTVGILGFDTVNSLFKITHDGRSLTIDTPVTSLINIRLGGHP